MEEIKFLTRGGVYSQPITIKTGSGELISFSRNHTGIEHINHSRLNYQSVIEINSYLNQFDTTQHFINKTNFL